MARHSRTIVTVAHPGRRHRRASTHHAAEPPPLLRAPPRCAPTRPSLLSHGHCHAVVWCHLTTAAPLGLAIQPLQAWSSPAVLCQRSFPFTHVAAPPPHGHPSPRLHCHAYSPPPGATARDHHLRGLPDSPWLLHPPSHAQRAAGSGIRLFISASESQHSISRYCSCTESLQHRQPYSCRYRTWPLPPRPPRSAAGEPLWSPLLLPARRALLAGHRLLTSAP